MSEPMFHIGLLSNYQLVTKPGTYYVSVAYTVTESNLILDEHSRYLVPLRAITSTNLLVLLEVLKDNPEVPFRALNNVFLTGALWYGDGSNIDVRDLPVKGEKVLATFDYDETENGKLLRCKHIELLPREELDYVDTSQLDEFLRTINNLITKSIN
jgi:hypothetical protein